MYQSINFDKLVRLNKKKKTPNNDMHVNEEMIVRRRQFYRSGRLPPPGLVRAADFDDDDEDAIGDAGGSREAELFLLLLAATLSACFALDAPASFLASLPDVVAFGAALPPTTSLPLIIAKKSSSDQTMTPFALAASTLPPAPGPATKCVV